MTNGITKKTDDKTPGLYAKNMTVHDMCWIAFINAARIKNKSRTPAVIFKFRNREAINVQRKPTKEEQASRVKTLKEVISGGLTKCLWYHEIIFHSSISWKAQVIGRIQITIRNERRLTFETILFINRFYKFQFAHHTYVLLNLIGKYLFISPSKQDHHDQTNSD